MIKVALMCCGRLENRYAVEWVEYYKQLGFNHIYIADNNYGDEEHFEEVLQPYIDEQFVTVYDYRNKQYVQCYAPIEMFNKIKNDYDWVFLCDFDEFLVLQDDKTIQDYLSRECFKDKNQILIKWKIYTDNDLIYDDGRPNLERFTTESTTDDWTKDLVKPFIKTSISEIFFNNTLHYFWDYYMENKSDNVMENTSDNILENTSCDYNGQKVELTLYGVPIGIQDNINNSLAYIKHFITKTVDEWVNNKLKRGIGDRDYDEYIKTISIDDFFKYNKVTDAKLNYLKERGFDISEYNN